MEDEDQGGQPQITEKIRRGRRRVNDTKIQKKLNTFLHDNDLFV